MVWAGLNTKSFAGQMVVGSEAQTPVTFCFIVNWNGPASEFPAVEAEFFAAIKDVLSVIKQLFGSGSVPTLADPDCGTYSGPHASLRPPEMTVVGRDRRARDLASIDLLQPPRTRRSRM